LRYARLILVGAALAVSACASRPALDANQCKQEGGTVEGVGMFATPACVTPYADAGKVCSDKSDCLGMCKAAEDAEVGSSAKGSCQKSSHDIFGCYNEVKSGIVVGGMCFD
jgi:hypothetical protein